MAQLLVAARGVRVVIGVSGQFQERRAADQAIRAPGSLRSHGLESPGEVAAPLDAMVFDVVDRLEQQSADPGGHREPERDLQPAAALTATTLRGRKPSKLSPRRAVAGPSEVPILE
jgi:hypothetical protein